MKFSIEDLDSALVLLLARWRDTAKLLRSIADPEPADAGLRASSEQLKCCADQLAESVRYAARGSGALTWSAEKPKRRGWWWVDGLNAHPPFQVVPVAQMGDEWLVLLWGQWRPVARCNGMRWAGPLPEPLEASDVEPLPNDKHQRAPKGDVR